MKAVLEIGLVRPYAQSLSFLLDLATIWRCDLVKVSPVRPFGIISMPQRSFKMIWGQEPRVAVCDVPKGTEHFIASVRVTNLLR